MLLKNTYIYASIYSSMTIDTIFRIVIYKWQVDRGRLWYEYTLLDTLNIWLQLLTFNIFSERKETSKVWKSVKLLLSLKAWAIKCFRNKLPIEGDMGAITRFCYSYQASSNIYYFSPTFNPHLRHKMAFIWIAYTCMCHFKSH